MGTPPMPHVQLRRHAEIRNAPALGSDGGPDMQLLGEVTKYSRFSALDFGLGRTDSIRASLCNCELNP